MLFVIFYMDFPTIESLLYWYAIDGLAMFCYFRGSLQHTLLKFFHVRVKDPFSERCGEVSNVKGETNYYHHQINTCEQ